MQPLSGHEYRLLVESSPVMIWRAGVDAACDYFNDTWLAFTGRTLEEERGEGWAQGVHPEDLERCVGFYLDHFRRRQPFEMEYRLRRHDGAYRWILDRGVPFHDEGGGFAGFIGSCVDVEARVQADAARNQQSERQLASARSFEQWMVAIVSHDIRSPLHVIGMSAQLLAERAGDAAFVADCARRLARSTRRIDEIVTDLLDVSRERQAGGIPIAPVDTDVQALCRVVVDEAVTTAAGRSIELRCRGETRGRWDASRVTQAVSNLVSNAVKHGEKGAPILVEVVGTEAEVVIEVKNAGVIPAELLPRIFDPFRSGTRTDRHGGLGLGLFIVEAIARGHGGRVEVESSAASGTSFRLILPRGNAR